MPSKATEPAFTEVKVRKRKKKQQQQSVDKKAQKNGGGGKNMACCSCARNRNSDILSEDPMLSDQHQYRYMTEDDMKSMGDDSMRVNVTDDEKDNRHSGVPTITEMITKESCNRLIASNQKPDNIDINRHPVHVGFSSVISASLESLNTSLAALGFVPKGQGMWRDRIPSWKNFLVSFLVDARGGAMRGCRHSGVRIIIPPRKATMPMRVTCRYLKRDKLSNPPPLMEGEALASRILELGPVAAKFLGPVIIEVPHFASLRGKEREIVILRSDNGETWREHTLEASEEAVQDVLNESFEGEELSQLEDLQTSRIVRILTVDFPHYFAVVSRIRQEVHAVGPDGGTVSSSAVPQVQAIFPAAALTKKIRVGLQAHPIPSELVVKLLGNRVAVSPIVTVEPRRRKFHKPIILTIPVPQAANKGMINQYSGDAPTLRLLCSITGGQSRAVWEDVTGSTPLSFVKDCVSFTTTVSARFWLMDCRNISEATKMATELYTHATHVPFMAKFVVFAKRVDPLEARLRVFCMTDDKEDKTLEHQEHFTEVAKSRDVEVLEGKTQYMEFAGNLVPVLKSGEQLQLPFRAFKENRVPFIARVKDPDAADMMGRIMFMSEPKVAKGEAPQTPICTLNILLPEKISPVTGTSELDLLQVSKNCSFTRDGGLSRPDSIHRATIRLTDISNLIDKDWEKLALELNITPNEMAQIKEKHPNNPPQQATAMFKVWQSNGNRATGNTLEKALNKIGRDDIVEKCIFNVELVTDDVEKAVARVRLDQPGFDSLKEELGPSRNTSLRRDATMDPKMDPDYEEPDRMKDSESTEDLDISGAAQKTTNHVPITNGNVHHATSTPIKDKYASDEKELADDMADFLEHKCHASDTVMKKSRDETDDYNRKRQKVYEDAKQLVSGVGQDAEKGTGKLAKEGWSVVYDEDVRKYDEVGHVLKPQKHSVSTEIVEPSIVRQQCVIKSNGDRVFATVSTEIVSSVEGRNPVSEISIDELRASIDEIDNAQPLKSNLEANDDNENKKIKDKSSGIFSGIFKQAKSKKDKSKGPADIYYDSGDEDTKQTTIKFLKDMQDTPGYMSDKDISSVEKSANVGSSVSGKSSTPNDGKSDEATSKHADDSTKEKSSGFFEIFKSPKLKSKDKSHSKKKSSRDVSLDSGDEDTRNTRSKHFGDSKKNINNPNDPALKNIDLIDANVEDKQQTSQSFIITTDSNDAETVEKNVTSAPSDTKDNEKSGGILNIFKSPKIKKKKSKSKERSISKEASVDSGDEQNRVITEKFLEDTKKISDLAESGHREIIEKDNALKSQKNGEYIPDKNAKSVDQTFIIGSTDSAAPTSSDMKAITSSFLEDSRNAAGVIDACPYKSLYLYKSTLPDELKQKEKDKTKDEIARDKDTKSHKKESTSSAKDKDETKADDKKVKEKKDGLLSGIFKGMKHASKEAVEDVKDFADETKKEAIEEEEKLKTSIKLSEKEKKSKPEKSKKSENAKFDSEIEKSNQDVERMDKLPKNLVEDIKDKLESGNKLSKTEHDVQTKTTTKIEDSAGTSTDDKEKVGFLSGIIKSVKHAAGDVSDGVKDFVDETKQEVAKGKEKLRRSVSKERSDSKEKVIKKSGKTIDNMESVELKDEKEISKIDADKSDKDKKEASKIGEKVSDDKEDIRRKDKIKKVDKKDDNEQVHDKDSSESKKRKKEKSEGLLSGFFKSSKHSEDEDKQLDEKKKDSTSIKVVKIESKEPNETILVTQQFLNDLQINTIPEPEMPIIDISAQSSSQNQIEQGGDKSKDGSKSKVGGFLSGILKSTKSLDEKEEKSEIKNKAGENLSIENASADVKAAKKTNDDVEIKSNKDTATKKGKEKSGGFLSGVLNDIKHVSEEATNAIKDIAQSKEEEAIEDLAKQDKKAVKKSVKNFDVNKDLDDSHNVGKTVDEAAEKITQKVKDHESSDEIAVRKEKEKSFFSGFFKSGKHTSDEIIDDMKETAVEMEQEALEEKKKVEKDVEKELKKVKDSVKSANDKSKEKIKKSQKSVDEAVEILERTSDQTVQDLQKEFDEASRTEGQLQKDVEDAAKQIKVGAIQVQQKIKKAKDEEERKIQDDADASALLIKKEKEKGTGFFTGLFKSAKHASDDVADDVKEFIEKAKQEALEEEEKAKNTAEKASSKVKDSAKSVKDEAKKKLEKTQKSTDKAVDDFQNTLDQAAQDLKSNYDQSLEAGKQFEKDIKETEENIHSENIQKLDKKIKKAKDDIKHELQDSADAAASSIKKEKEKGAGFFSGLFKGAKHASDEIADEVKEFVEDTKQEALDEEEKMKKDAEKIKDSTKATKDEAKKKVEKKQKNMEKVVSEFELTPGTVAKDLQEEIDRNLTSTAKTEEKLEKDIKDVAKNIETDIQNLEKKTKKAKDDVEKKIQDEADTALSSMKKEKEKGAGFFSGLFKSAKHASEEIADEVKDFVEETKQEALAEEDKIKKDIEIASSKVKDSAKAAKDEAEKKVQGTQKNVDAIVDDLKHTTDQNAQDLQKEVDEISVTTKQFEKDIDNTVKNVQAEGSEKLKKKTKKVKDDVEQSIKETTGAAESSLKKGKDKGAGFFSGLFKSAKHASDDAADDVKDLVKGTKQQALEKEEKAKNIAENIEAAASNTSRIPGEITDEVVDSVKSIKEKTTTESKKALDNIEKTVIDFESTSDKAAKNLKNEFDKNLKDISKTEKQIEQDIENIEKEGTEKLKKKAEKVKDEIEQEIQDTADATESTIKKEKEKGLGFFSGLLKTAKHATVEIADEVKEFVDETKQEALKEEENAKKISSDIKESAKATKEKAKKKAEKTKKSVDKVSDDLEHSTKEVTETLTHEINENLKIASEAEKQLKKDIGEVGNIVIEEDENIKKKLKKVKHDVDDKVENSADAAVISIKKEKEKGAGFLSGLFKSAKHAPEEITGEVTGFVEGTKKEALQEENNVKKETEKVSNEVTDFVKAVKKDAKQKVQEAKKNVDDVVDDFECAPEQATQDLKKAIDNASKTEQQLEKEIEDASKQVERDVEKLKKKSKKTKDDVEKKIQDDTDAAVSSIKKEKEKGAGFFSGIFKSAKHASDDVADELKDVVEKTKQEALEDDKKAKNAAEKITDDANKVKDSSAKNIKEKADKLKTKVFNVGELFKQKSEVADKNLTDEIDGNIKEVSTEIKIGTKESINTEHEKAQKDVKEVTDDLENASDKVARNLETTFDESLKDKEQIEKIIKDDASNIQTEAQKLKIMGKKVKDGIEQDIDDTAEASASFIKKEKEKSAGFFSGLLKTAKHATEGIADDVKEFVGETKQEALKEEEKVKKDAEKASQDIKDSVKATKEKAKKKTQKSLDKAVDEIEHTTDEAAKHVKDEANKDLKKVSDAEKELGKEIKNLVETVESESAQQLKKTKKAKDDVEQKLQDEANVVASSIKKEKEKGAGFFSGLFKSAKHASDDVADDVKEFMENAKQEALEEEENVKETSEKILDDINKTKTSSVEEVEQKIDTIKQDVYIVEQSLDKHVGDSKLLIDKTGKKLSSELADASDNVEEKIKHISGKIEGGIGETSAKKEIKVQKIAENADRETKSKNKEKSSFISSLFGGLKHTSDEISSEAKGVVKDTKDGVEKEHEKAEKSIETSVDELEDTLDKSAENVKKEVQKDLNVTLEAGNKIQDDIKNVVENIEGEDAQKLKKKAKKVKDGLERDIQDTADATESTIKKEKEKSIGFFSGLLKSAKHATEDIADEVKEFAEETKQEALEDEEKAKKDAEKISLDVKDTVKATKEKAKKKAEKTEKNVSEIIDEIESSPVKVAKDLQVTLDAGKKIGEDIQGEVKSIETEAAGKLKKKTKKMKDDIEDSADAATSSIKKEKEKGAGFFSGLFKGAKHVSDEITDEVKEFVEDTKQEALDEEEKMKKDAEKVKDSAKATKDGAKKKIEKTQKNIEVVVNELEQTPGIVAKDLQEEINRNLTSTAKTEEKLEKDIKDVAKNIVTDVQNLEKKTKKAKDDVEKKIQDEAGTASSSMKKEKEKGAGFFSGLFKSAKHASEEIADEVKDFVEETKQEALEEEDKIKKDIEKASSKVKGAAKAAKDEAEKNLEKTQKNVEGVVGELIQSPDKITKNLKEEVDKNLMSVKVEEQVEKDIKDAAKDVETSVQKLEKKSKKAKSDVQQKVQDEADAVTSTIKKEKGAGFLSGLFKSAKHASEDATNEVKELTKEKQQKVLDAGKITEKNADKVTDDVNLAFSEFEKEIGNISRSSDQQIQNAKDSTIAMIEKEKDNFLQDVENKKQEITEGIDRKGKEIDQESSKQREKAEKDAKNKIDHLKEKIDETKGKVSGKIEKISDDIKKESDDVIKKGDLVVVDISKNIQNKTHETNQNIEQKIEDVTGTAASAAKKEKAKAEGFLSRIFKGVHQTADDVVGEAEETQKTVSQTEKNITKSLKEIDKNIKQTIDDIDDSKKNIEKDISKEPQTVIDIQGTKLDAKITHEPKADTSRSSSPSKKKKDKSDGYLSGILKSAKHVKEELVSEVKEIAEETKNEAIKDEEKVKKAAEKASKASKNVKDKADENLKKHMDKVEEGVSTSKEQLKEDVNNLKVEMSDAEKRVTDEINKISDSLDEKNKDIIKKVENVTETSTEKIKESVNDAKQNIAKKIQDVSDSTKSATKKEKEKASNTLFGIFKGAKSTSGKAADEIKESAEEIKPVSVEVQVTDKTVKGKGKHGKSKISKSTKELSQHIPDPQQIKSIDTNEIRADQSINPILETKVCEGLAQSVPPEAIREEEMLNLSSTESSSSRRRDEPDDKTTTQIFLEDLKASAARMGDVFPDTERAVRSGSSSKQSSLERDSSEEKDGKEKKKKSGIISSIVKKTKRGTHKIIQEVDNAAEGLKDATGKFWEETKRESRDSRRTGSYDVNPSTDKSSKAIDEVVSEEPIVKLTSLRQSSSLASDEEKQQLPIQVRQSNIPETVAFPDDPSRSYDIQSTSFQMVKESITVVTSNVSSSLIHSEPHAHQTVTTVITKSVRTAATPPPSPAELTDNVNKEITEEAARRAQAIIANREPTLKSTGHDSAEIDGTVERHASSTPKSKEPAPAPRSPPPPPPPSSTRCETLPDAKSRRAPLDLAASQTSMEHTDNQDSLIIHPAAEKEQPPSAKEQKSSANERIAESRAKEEPSRPVSLLGSSSSFLDEQLASLEEKQPNRAGMHEEKLEQELLPRLGRAGEEMGLSDPLIEALMDERQGASWRSFIHGGSGGGGGGGGSGEASLPVDYWETSLSTDVSPISGNEAGFKSSSRQTTMTASDTDSDGCSPHRRRSSASKRRTLGSSSGSDVALHEGAELSPMEDDQENDFLQQNEPAFMETITTENNPETHESSETKITRTTTITTTTSAATMSEEPSGAESTHKIVDQFMTEERKDH